MRLCLLPYYTKDQFSGDIKLNKSTFENISELKESVELMLEGDLPFRINSTDSDTEYEDSINDLILTLYTKIENLNLKFDFNAVAKREVNKFVKGLVMPKPLTTTEELIQANIAGSDLITEEERRNIKFNNLIRSIYGKSASPLNESRQNEFNNNMLLLTIIDTSKKKLITNVKELNEGILSFLLQQYEVIKSYLISLGYNLSDYNIPLNLYRLDSKSGVLVMTKGYYNILTLMYNIIEKSKLNNSLELNLEDGWTKFIFNNKDTTLYRAVNAYINLAYFDDVLKLFLGEYIQINTDYDTPISIIKNQYDIPTITYKYSFAKGNKFATKTWGVEDHDALKEMSKFSLVLIKSIPVYEYNIENSSESESFGKMEVKDFVNTISKLLDLSSLITNPIILNAICTFLSNPRESILSILLTVFKNTNKNILNNLSDLGFDLNYINYLYSIYKTCFKDSNSWDAIELRYIRNNRLPDTYPIINTILGIMNSNVANNFLLTTYNHDSQKYETTVKKKYNISNTKFDIITNVNSTTIDRGNKSEILNMYKLSRSNRNYSITLNSYGNLIKFEFNPLNNTGILDKKSESTNLNISNIPNLKDFNLESINYRRHLIGGVDLSEEELKLMTMLRFIDTMLSTNFSSDLEGLRKLNLLQNIKSSNFKELFASAARALVVTDIYNQFETATKEDGTKYSKLELQKFLEDKKPYSDAIQSFNSKQQKPYFIERYDGVLLSTLYSSLSWLDSLSLVEAILSGETSKSVISNLDGDKIPNFSPLFLGARIELLLKASETANDATSNLLFVKYRNAIKEKVINTDILTKDGVRKLIKNMTSGELLYDSIVNKFFAPLLLEGIIYTLPTVYSDKTKFLLYGISLKSLGINTLIGDSFDRNIEKLMSDTLGNTYKEIYNNVVNDYKKLFPEFINNDTIDLDLILDWFNTHSVLDLQNRINNYNAINKTNLVFYKDTHFREIELNDKKCLSINELLIEYAFNLYGDKLHSRLLLEKLNFLNDLLSNRVTFPILRDPDNQTRLISKSESDSITGILIHLLGPNALKWVHGSNMILAKATDKNGKVRDILYGDIQEGETIELNPALNAYFMLDNLIGNNLRMSLTGSEINHKVKSLSKLNLNNSGAGLYKSLIKTLNPSYHSENQITFYDILKALYNYNTLLLIKELQRDFDNPNTDPEIAIGIGYAIDLLSKEMSISQDVNVDPVLILALSTIYDNQIHKIENAAQNAQFKRNVIIPGTMRPYTPNCIDGIGSKVKVAVINDVSADVFNFDGKSETIDAHDGSAMESPITSILENKSLLDSEVGTIKKPIHHWYDDRFGTATLLKYAVDTITNQWMRLAEGNNLTNPNHAIRLKNVFKKMHHVRWYNNEAKVNGQRGIDLIDGCDYKSRKLGDNFHSIDFFTDVLNEHSLFYKKGNQDIQIIDFGIENGIYYTIEQNVDPYGNSEGEGELKVYHYFDEEGNHFPSNVLLTNSELHTIDSLYELHSAMGGIYSESINSEGSLQYSEASNIVVSNFVNLVAYKKDPNQSNKVTVDLINYYLPLKEMLIDIVANNSAVKNGAGNVNPSTSFYDNNKLSYIEIGTSLYGILMDADHTADEGLMTEFSQVISSLDAGGRLHDYVSQIYQTLGDVATLLSQIELDAVESFRNGEGKSKMYDIIGRTIINNFAKDKEGAGLASAIIENVKKDFNLNTDHELDEIKIAFSDPNIYSNILSTFVSIINKKSIKRQYPGQGTVMVPGYDLSMIYDLDGKTYLFEDLIQMAISEGYLSTYTDTSEYNRDIVKLMLLEKLKNLPVLSFEKFQPTDNILISFDIPTNVENLNSGELFEALVPGEYHASLKNIQEYYLFKDSIVLFLESKGIVGATNIKLLKDITIPRNLAPAKISWDFTKVNPITGEEEVHSMNIFDHWRIKGLFLKIREINNTKGISKEEKKRRILLARKLFNPLQAFDELDKGIYVDEGENLFSISNLQNVAAELIMSHLYKTKFGLHDKDSLSAVMDKGYNYFKSSAKLISSTNYDIAFTKLNGKHLYLTFKPLWQDNNDSFDAYRKNWSNTIIRDYTYPENTDPKDKIIIHRVYATTKDNLELFEVGREILRNDILWDSSKKKFIDKDGKILKNQQKYRRYGEDKVLEYIEFLSQYNVQEEIDGKVNKYTVYNINRSALKSVFYKTLYNESVLSRQDKDGNTYTITADQKFDEEINDFISRKLLAKVYESSDFNGVLLNSTVTSESHTIIKNCLYRFGNALLYDPELSLYLSVDLLDRINNSTSFKDGLITYKKLNSVVNNYRTLIAKKKYASFLKSLNFTVSRIPALTLLSFMKMKCVGFTGTVNNQCFVSHWLTW